MSPLFSFLYMWYALLTGRCTVRVSAKGDFL
nr:MAG TPA: hypothetical protein [Caudoviricetes sp.]